MRDTRVQTPRGVKDILPKEASIKSALERRAADLLERWGYARVITPTFEFEDALKAGDGPILSDQLYRFVDREGATLALRSEMTIPIARLVATRYRSQEMPLRLYYVGNVFRYDEPQAGRHREFTQIGVELLGTRSVRADAEVVVLAAALFQDWGLRSFRLDLGHVAYFQGLVAGVDDAALIKNLRQALLQRDYVRYEGLVAESRLAPKRKRALQALPTLRGSLDCIEEARGLAADVPGARVALDELFELFRLAQAYGLEHAIGIDLGMIKDFDYYSGLLIEGYVPELGFTLCTGGRYDELVGRFGWDCPARGFAFGVERAMLALDRQGHNEERGADPPDLFLFTDEADAASLFYAASYLRARGVNVALDVDDKSVCTWERARAKGARRAAKLIAGEVGGETSAERAALRGSSASSVWSDLRLVLDGDDGPTLTLHDFPERRREWA